MRRSRSSSGIPMRSTNLFNANTKVSGSKTDLKASLGGRERSRSVTSVGFKRNPSLERWTPLSQNAWGSGGKMTAAGLYSRKQSSTPSTPSTYIERKNSGSSQRSTFYSRPNEPASEHKILQKQINDKKWVAERFAMVQDFIRNGGLFEAQLATQIKPPTIKTLVEVFSTLFKEVFMSVNINSQNYAEAVVQNLKILKYPGSITVSTVKTANTLHGWPNFIAMTSWLIEKLFPDMMYEQQITENVSDRQRLVFEIMRTSYAKWTDPDQKPPADPEDMERFLAEYAKLLGVEPDADAKITKQIEDLVAQIEHDTKNNEELVERNQEIRKETDYRKEVINEFQCDTGEKLEKLKVKLAQTKKTLDERRNQNRELKELVSNLSGQVETQSCKLKDKKRMLYEIENCKKNKERRSANILEYYRIRDEMDMDYQSKISQLEKEVDAWNVVITKTFLPELQKLRLRDKGFHSQAFLEEIREIQKERVQMEMSFVEEVEKIKVEIEDLEKRKEQLVKTNKMVHDLLAQIKGLEKEKIEISDEMTNAQNIHQERMRVAEEHANVEFLKQTSEIEVSQKRLAELKEKFLQIARKGVSDALDLNKYISEKILECHTMARTASELKMKKLERLNGILISKHEELEKVKSLVESVEQEFNEPLFEKEDSI